MGTLIAYIINVSFFIDEDDSFVMVEYIFYGVGMVEIVMPFDVGVTGVRIGYSVSFQNPLMVDPNRVMCINQYT